MVQQGLVHCWCYREHTVGGERGERRDGWGMRDAGKGLWAKLSVVASFITWSGIHWPGFNLVFRWYKQRREREKARERISAEENKEKTCKHSLMHALCTLLNCKHLHTWAAGKSFAWPDEVMRMERKGKQRNTEKEGDREKWFNWCRLARVGAFYSLINSWS